MITLLSLPDELLLAIARYTATDKDRQPYTKTFKVPTLHDTSSFVRTCRRLAPLANRVLYDACLADGGSRALEWAASNNSIAVAKVLIETYDVDVNIRAEKVYSHNGETDGGPATTALHVAAWSGSVEVTNYLLEKGADLNAITSSYNTQSGLIQALFEREHHLWFSAQPVHFAAISGSADVVKLLVARGCDTASTCIGSRTETSYSTPTSIEWNLVDIAAYRGDYVLFDYLTHDNGIPKEGTNFIARANPQNGTLIELLLKACLDSHRQGDAKLPQYEAILRAMLASDTIPLLDNYVHGPYGCILGLAVLPHSTALLKQLLRKMGLLDRAPEVWRGDPNITDQDRSKLQDNLDTAVLTQILAGRAHMQDMQPAHVSLLVSCGANLNSYLWPLHRYIRNNIYNSAAGIRFLVAQGADINALTQVGYSPLFLALMAVCQEYMPEQRDVGMRARNRACTRELLHLGADVEMVRRYAYGDEGLLLELENALSEEYDREAVDKVFEADFV